MTQADGAASAADANHRSKISIFVCTLIVLTVAMLVALVVLSFFWQPEVAAKRPHIIFIMADDLGWNDVGFHGSNQIPTPNIDALAYAGLILNQHYVSPLCTPSRSSLMTGKLPIHTGMQHEVIYGFEPWGLGLDQRLLPQYLKDDGYATHLVGKWHLGHFSAAYTPTHRGFDSHFGFWSGHHDYYDHFAEENPGYWGFDMRRGLNASLDTIGKYTTTLLDEEAVRVIHQHDASEPLFLFLAHAAPHAGNPSIPLQAPEELVNSFDPEFIPGLQRRKFAAMMTLLDQSVGNVMSALSEKGMLENSIVVFSSDNGGAGGGYNRNVASNWPLRGGKDTNWEGGVRAAALIWSPLLRRANAIFEGVWGVHDWLPTLLAASGNRRRLKGIDGKNVWPALNDPSKRTYDQILLHLDDARNVSAIRWKNWKFLNGTTWNGAYDVSLGNEGRQGEYNLTLVQQSAAAQAIAKTNRPLPDASSILSLRNQATVNCSKEWPQLLCKPTEGQLCLFDLAKDPCESVNMARHKPDIVAQLAAAVDGYRRSALPPRNQPGDPLSNPKFWDYQWTHWRDFPTPPHLQSQLVAPQTSREFVD